MKLFINSEYEIEDIEDYCVITYKMPHGKEEVSLSTAKEAVVERKKFTILRKFLYIVEEGVVFSPEAMKYFAKDVSIEGIDSSAIYRKSNGLFNAISIIASNLVFNVFLIVKSKPKMKFFNREKNAVKWIKKQ